MQRSIAAFGDDAIEGATQGDTESSFVPFAGADAFTKHEIKYIWEASNFSTARLIARNVIIYSTG